MPEPNLQTRYDNARHTLSNGELFIFAQQLLAANGDYRSTRSSTKARLYLDALNTMIPLLPQRQQMGGVSGELIQWSLSDLLKLRADTERWLSANQTGRRISYSNPCGYRD